MEIASLKRLPNGKLEFENELERTKFMLRLAEKKIEVQLARNRLKKVNHEDASKLRRAEVVAALQRHLLEENAGEEAKRAWKSAVKEVHDVIQSYGPGSASEEKAKCTPEDMLAEVAAVLQPRLLAKGTDASVHATEEIVAAIRHHLRESRAEMIAEIAGNKVLAEIRVEKEEIETKLKSF